MPEIGTRKLVGNALINKEFKIAGASVVVDVNSNWLFKPGSAPAEGYSVRGVRDTSVQDAIPTAARARQNANARWNRREYSMAGDGF